MSDPKREVERAVDEVVASAEAAIEDVVASADDAIDELTGMPDDGRISRFSWQGAELVAEERGGGETTFLLVHGIGMGRKVFGDVSVRLAEHGRVIAIDQPGYGEAEEPPRTPAIERVADLVAAFIRDRNLGRPVLIGHSMGTQVVAEVAARHPDIVSAVVLVAPTVDDAARHPVRQLWRLARDLFGESARVLVLGAREYVRAGPHLRRKMRAMLTHRPEDAYPRIRASALVIRGERDVVCPASWCRRVASMLPDAEYAEVPDHGHETMIRDGAPAASLILSWFAAR